MLAVRRADRVLLNAWVSRSGNAVFIVSVIVVVMRWAIGADVLTVLTPVSFILGIVLMAAPPLRRWSRGRQLSPGIASTESTGETATAEAVTAAVRDELVAILDEGYALRPRAFQSFPYGPYQIWHDKTEAFVLAVFGTTEEQRFRETRGSDLGLELEKALRWLRERRDQPASWRLLVDSAGLREAADERRSRSQQERIVLASAGPSLHQSTSVDAGPTDPAQRLRQAYRAGARVQSGSVVIGGGSDTEEALAEVQRRAWERAVEWAIATWEMLSQYFPGHRERAFFGDSANYGLARTGFRMNAQAEEEAGTTVNSYVDEKLAILADLLWVHER